MSAGAWHYDDSDIERLSMIMTLHDVGFTNEEVHQYMSLWVQGEATREVSVHTGIIRELYGANRQHGIMRDRFLGRSCYYEFI